MIGFILIHLRTEGVGRTVMIRLIFTKEMRERLRHERILKWTPGQDKSGSILRG